jgi:hypothetical protein
MCTGTSIMLRNDRDDCCESIYYAVWSSSVLAIMLLFVVMLRFSVSTVTTSKHGVNESLPIASA